MVLGRSITELNKKCFSLKAGTQSHTGPRNDGWEPEGNLFFTSSVLLRIAFQQSFKADFMEKE